MGSSLGCLDRGESYTKAGTFLSLNQSLTSRFTDLRLNRGCLFVIESPRLWQCVNQDFARESGSVV